jgi:hypothetical protein
MRLYNKMSIVIFSILLTGVGSSIMLGYNLRTAGKNKIVVPLVLISLVANAVIRQLVKNILPGSLMYSFFIPNVILGLILAFPVWDKYLADLTSYEAKSLWIPSLIVLLLYGGLTVLALLQK